MILHVLDSEISTLYSEVSVSHVLLASSASTFASTAAAVGRLAGSTCSSHVTRSQKSEEYELEE